MSDEDNKNDQEVISEDGNSSLNLEPNVTAVLAYVGMVITGIIILLIEKKNKFVRFHAMQSICFFAAVWVVTFVVGWIPFIGWLLSGVMSAVGFIGWVVLMFKAYNKEYYKVPIIGDYAEDFIKKL